jgi:hypothetical protein
VTCQDQQLDNLHGRFKLDHVSYLYKSEPIKIKQSDHKTHKSTKQPPIIVTKTFMNPANRKLRILCLLNIHGCAVSCVDAYANGQELPYHSSDAVRWADVVSHGELFSKVFLYGRGIQILGEQILYEFYIHTVHCLRYKLPQTN